MTIPLLVAEPQIAEKIETDILEYTVSTLAFSLRKTVESAYQFVKVRGEISGAKYHGSGHLYFALKDTEAVIDAVCWRPIVSRLSYILEDGMDVVCTGKITTYPGRSKYQIVVDSITLAGQGALLKLLEERKHRLKTEGLFALERKKELPFLPQVIGVITSPTGAVIRDILHRLDDRFPSHVLLWPVAVQGDGAAEQVAKAIDGFNRLPKNFPRPDVIIIARGGGSLEDLWAFNEECVVRATANSLIPTVSAIGHETDHTLIDLAADVRMPTPTAAAERVVPVRMQLWSVIQDYHKRIDTGIVYYLKQKQLQLKLLAKSLPDVSWNIDEKTQRFYEWTDRLEKAMHFRLQYFQNFLVQQTQLLKTPDVFLRLKQETIGQITTRMHYSIDRLLERSTSYFHQFTSLLYSLSPDRILERGYVIVLTPENHIPLTSKAAMNTISTAELKFTDGLVKVYTHSSSQHAPKNQLKDESAVPFSSPKKNKDHLQDTLW